MDAIDRAIVNRLQCGFPICARPFAAAAVDLGVTEDELIARVDVLVESKTLSRFGPMFNAERLGGAVTLAAMAVPEADFERVQALVNAFPEVAHNYEREHHLNMWFVLATDQPQRIDTVLAAIEQQTGHRVYNMPKLDEFYIGLQLEI